MLVIRTEQLEALGHAALDNFIRAVCDGARMKLPELCANLAEPDLIALVGAAIDKAAALGIDEPDGQIFMTHLVLAHGLDFETSDELRWTAPLLHNGQLSGATRLALLIDRLPPRLRPGASAGGRLP